VAVLSGFAEKYGIAYPLLSDEGSVFIRELGILNEQAAENVAGIPHPGVFVLEEDGTVRSRHFYPSYRERDTGGGLLQQVIGLPGPVPPHVEASRSDGVVVRAWLDRASYSWGQRLWLTVELEIEPGLHVYGRPVPDGYTPVTITVDPIELVTIGEAQWPAPRPFRVEGLEEEFWVYEGRLRVSLPLSFLVVDAGQLTVRVRVDFQACSATDCLLPQSKEFALVVEEAPLVERPVPPPRR
jgi:hypothetical protein